MTAIFEALKYKSRSLLLMRKIVCIVVRLDQYHKNMLMEL